jgi:hypothetical protein
LFDMEAEPAKSPDYVVTLVHGTFARNAAWTQDGSALRTSFRDRLGDGSVRFDCFLWSGFNTDRARQEAAAELRRILGQRLAEHPEARHYIVAHSHGGNVALHALHGFEDQERIAGVICLASPFIHCAPRDVRKSVKTLRSAALTLWTIAYWYLAPTAVLVWLAVVGLLWFRVFQREGPVERWATRRQEAVVRAYRPADQIVAPFLCVHATRDEAGRILGLTGLASETPYWLDRGLEALDIVPKLVAPLLFGLTVMIALYASIYSGWFTGQGLNPSRPGLAALVSAALTVVALAAWIGLRTLRIPLEVTKFTLPVGLRRVAFGSTGLTSYWLARFWTEHSPFGVKELTLKPYVLRVPFFALRRRLRHSDIYTNKAVLEDAITWLTSLSAKPTPSTGG